MQNLQGDHYIRLLTLYPCNNEDDEIACTLEQHDFDKAIPTFIALSYVWGSLEDPKTILVNGCTTTVTSNLHAALRHIRHDKVEKIIWIDALCIDQENAEEKARQIPLMRDIYLVAHHVLAWLGEAAAPGVESADRKATFTDIISRPYWNRVWVIQEFVLGRVVVLQCGRTQYDWSDIYNHFYEDAELRSKLPPLFGMKRRANWDSYQLDFFTVLRAAFRANATDARDKVFGIQGLAPMRETAHSELLKPDYGLSVCEVYARVIEVLRLDERVTLPPTDILRSWKVNDSHRSRCEGVTCGTVDMLKEIVFFPQDGGSGSK